MDDRGCLARPLTETARRPAAKRVIAAASGAGRARIPLALDRCSDRLGCYLPKGIGIVAGVVLMLASLGYGVVRGGHLPMVFDAAAQACDQLGNAAGFRIVAVALTGNRHVTREEVLASAGVTGMSSLLFLNVERTRDRLRANAWIADASVLKLYPGELKISISERTAFALWQKDGRVSVIAEDGTVLEPYPTPDLIRLPLVVGTGAQLRAKEFLRLLARIPAIQTLVRASVLVGERRWNLRLVNGIDVELPEFAPDAALGRLLELEHDKSLISRDIATIDLRLADRVTVRLSDAAAQARIEAIKDKVNKKGGSA